MMCLLAQLAWWLPEGDDNQDESNKIIPPLLFLQFWPRPPTKPDTPFWGCRGVWRIGGGVPFGPKPNTRPQKYPDEVGGNIPSNVPVMYPAPGKMVENGGKWGGNGVLWGEVGANNKNCGARVDWFSFPIFPHFPPFPRHFPPFSLGSFHQRTPPPHSLVANQNHVF